MLLAVSHMDTVDMNNTYFFISFREINEILLLSVLCTLLRMMMKFLGTTLLYSSLWLFGVLLSKLDIITVKSNFALDNFVKK